MGSGGASLPTAGFAWGNTSHGILIYSGGFCATFDCINSIMLRKNNSAPALCLLRTLVPSHPLSTPSSTSHPYPCFNFSFRCPHNFFFASIQVRVEFLALPTSQCTSTTEDEEAAAAATAEWQLDEASDVRALGNRWACDRCGADAPGLAEW